MLVAVGAVVRAGGGSGDCGGEEDLGVVVAVLLCSLQLVSLFVVAVFFLFLSFHDGYFAQLLQ